MAGKHGNSEALGAPLIPSPLGATCIAMHALLVLAHVALVVVYVLHLEHHVIVDIGTSSNMLSVTTTVIAQVIATVRYSL